MNSLSKIIINECNKSEISISLETGIQLEKYIGLLNNWNQYMDLTSVTNINEIISRHIIDSLSPIASKIDLLPKGVSIIDIGSGAGLPGIPLAIARPDISVTLLDSQKKRVNFLNTVINDISLKNVKTVHGRAEDIAILPEYKEFYDIATARAVAPLNVLLEYLMPYVKIGGFALCWKGPSVDKEWLDGEYSAANLGGSLEVPIEANRFNNEYSLKLIRCTKTYPLPPQFPRKAGMAKKRPLLNNRINSKDSK